MPKKELEITSKQKIKKHFVDDIITSILKLRDKGSFNIQDKIFFLKEIAHLLNGGISIIEAMQIIYTSSDNFAVKEIAKEIFGYIKKGKTLSYALNRMPQYFNEGDYNITRAGETSGNLNIVLDSLSKEYSYLQTIQNKYIGALMYPAILLVIAIVAALALFLLVLPSIFSITDGFVIKELPTSTRIAKQISDFLLHNGIVFLVVSALSVFVLSVFFSTQTGKKVWYDFILSMPVIGKMTKYYYLNKLCRYMKVMLKSGMNFLDMFVLLRDILGIPAYQQVIEKVIVGLQKGDTIYDSLKYDTDLIPSNVAVLIKVGEETANLQTSIDNVLNMYEEELNTLINGIAKIIEPVMLVFIGGIMIFIALAVFGLIFQVMDVAGV